MPIRAWMLVLASLVAPPALASASECRTELAALGIEFTARRVAHVPDAVEVRGPLGGVEYRGYRSGSLVVGCKLALTLARSGRFFREHGIRAARYSSAYSRRRIRSSGRWSQHAYGLAIDLHSFTRDDGSVLVVSDHYEQGLGDEVDCVGAPLTAEGAMLRTLSCQLERSNLWDNVLDPDYDAFHFNHFHLDVGE